MLRYGTMVLKYNWTAEFDVLCQKKKSSFLCISGIFTEKSSSEALFLSRKGNTVQKASQTILNFQVVKCTYYFETFLKPVLKATAKLNPAYLYP